MDNATSSLTDWIGRSETVDDIAYPTPAIAPSATLDHPRASLSAGDPLPPLWHWLYFLPMHRQSEIGTDGHAKRGGFLPPVPLPRRMWAAASSSSAGRSTFERGLTSDRSQLAGPDQPPLATVSVRGATRAVRVATRSAMEMIRVARQGAFDGAQLHVRILHVSHEA